MILYSFDQDTVCDLYVQRMLDAFLMRVKTLSNIAAIGLDN